MILALLLTLALDLTPKTEKAPLPAPNAVKKYGTITIDYQFDSETKYFQDDKEVKFEDIDLDKYEADTFTVDSSKKHVDKLIFRKKK